MSTCGRKSPVIGIVFPTDSRERKRNLSDSFEQWPGLIASMRSCDDSINQIRSGCNIHQLSPTCQRSVGTKYWWDRRPTSPNDSQLISVQTTLKPLGLN